MGREDTYAAAYRRGEARLEDVDDWVDTWHDGPEGFVPLHQFFGLTSEEYSQWALNPSALEEILATHA